MRQNTLGYWFFKIENAKANRNIDFLFNMKPSKKDVVELLMTKKYDIKKDIISRRGGSPRFDVAHHVYACPKGEKCKDKGEVIFEKSTGYTNPYRHLKSCLSNGSEENLLKIYESSLTELKDKNSVSSRMAFVPSSISANERQQSMHAFLRLVTLNNYPISHVQSPELRSFSKYNAVIGKNDFHGTLLQVVELVEDRIKQEMQQTKGSLLFDGWTENGFHYVGVYAVYVRKFEVFRNGISKFEEEVAVTLLSVSPMSKMGTETSDSDIETSSTATSFDAETHVRHFENVFAFYGVDVHKWTLCIVGDNASVNRLAAKLMEKPFIGCFSHKLNLEVQEMIKKNNSLNTIITSIHETMSNCLRKLRDRAMLRNITALGPIIHNTTRWSSKYTMLRRFNEIRTHLIQVADSEGASVTVNRTDEFRNTCSKYEKQFQFINQCTLQLQKHAATLSDCRYSVDAMCRSIQDYKDDTTSPLYRCSLGTKYLGENAPIITDPLFESGVIKIQRGEISELSDLEKMACSSLSLSPTIERVGASNRVTSELDLENVIREEKRRKIEKQRGYVNCSFILGSVAEVERLWSIAKTVRNVNRKQLTPLMFEAILFLKCNKQYWDQNLVVEAMNLKRSARVESQILEDSATLVIQ